MQNNPPLIESLQVDGALARWTGGWTNWFTQVFQCLPWKKGFTATATIDFGSVSANSQLASSAITVTGARPATADRASDVVLVTPSADTTGIDFKARVTANDQVTIYAINFTTGAINPPSLTFRIIVLQN